MRIHMLNNSKQLKKLFFYFAFVKIKKSDKIKATYNVPILVPKMY